MMGNFLKHNRWPLIIAAAAVLIRFVYLWELSRLPDFAVLIVDEKWHWLWAEEIRKESFWGAGAYFRAPLYPYFLALLAWITSGSILVSKLLQVLLTGGTAWFIYRLAERLFSHKAAILAGFIYAAYSVLIFYESTFLIPVLFLFLLVWGMFRVVAYRESQSWLTWLATGAVFGLAAISRPNVLLVLPFLLLWLFLTGTKVGGLARRIKFPAVLLAGLVIPILPVTIRNAAVTGDFMLISSQGGINLYLGNNPEADGLTMLMPEVDLDESVPWDQFEIVTKTAAEREAGRELSSAELSSFWTAKALKFMVNNPGTFLSLVWKKTVFLLSGFENSDNTDIYHQQTKSALYSFLLWEKPIYFPFGLLLPLFLVGLYATRKEHRKLMPIYIFLLCYIPSIILFLVTARHRLPLVPFMIIVAAGGLVTLWQAIRKQSPGQLAAILLIFVVPLLVFNRTYYGETKTSPFQIYFNEGMAFEKIGDYARAEQSYLRADRDYPYSAPLINNLGHAQLKLGKIEVAEINLRRAIALDSSYAHAWNNLGLVMYHRGQYDSALLFYQTAAQTHDQDIGDAGDLCLYYLNAAGAYEAKGVADSAEMLLRFALNTDSEYAEAYFDAASFYIRRNDFFKGDSLFTTGMRYGTPTAAKTFNWGLSFLKRRDFPATIDRMYRVLAMDTTFYQAYHCLAVAYYESLSPVDSVNKYLDLTLRYNPAYQPALELRKLVPQN